MPDIILIPLTLLVGFISSFIGSIVGGGGLMSIPFLILIGLPPQIAIPTNKLGSIGLTTGAVYKYWKEKQILWEYVTPLVVLGIVGAYIGANLLVNINQELLSKVITVILISFLPILLIKKDFGIKHRETTSTKKAIGYIIFFLISIFGGFFGGGAGILASFTLMSFFGLNIIHANATDMVPAVFVTVVSFVILAMNGIVDYQIGIVLFVGMIAGGYAGAHTAVKKGTGWVKGLLVVVVIASVIKLLFF